MSACSPNLVVILTALDIEYQAVRADLDGFFTYRHPAGTLFEIGYPPSSPGAIAIGVTGIGIPGAAVLTERAISAFQPHALLFVGMAAALADDIALGDVIVATRMYAYHGGRSEEGGFRARPHAWDAPHQLEQLARHVARTGSWHASPVGFALARPPVVHFKPIAAGEVVLNSGGSALARQIRCQYDDAAAIETEGAGAAQAGHLNQPLPVLIIRGIADRADGQQDFADTALRQATAAFHAARFAVSLASAIINASIQPGPLRTLSGQPSIWSGPPHPPRPRPGSGPGRTVPGGDRRREAAARRRGPCAGRIRPVRRRPARGDENGGQQESSIGCGDDVRLRGGAQAMTDFTQLPSDLPVPVDDGAASHLPGRALPAVKLTGTNGDRVALDRLGTGRTVLYLYPMTGRPGVDLPAGWDLIPGARGCTPEACAFRDHHADLLAAGASAVYGLSSQDTDYQRELATRLNLPFAMLSDADLALAKALDLPTFPAGGQVLYRRLTMIVRDGRVEHVFYPVFPPDRHAEQVLTWLREHPAT